MQTLLKASARISKSQKKYEIKEGYTPYWYVRLSNGTDMFSALFYVEGESETLPAGTYAINDTYEVGTAQAGQISNGSVYPCVYGTLTEDGYINVPLFLCTAGEIVVSYDEAGNLQLVANATNTWMRSAHITLKANEAPIGISMTSADPMVYVQDGLLCIQPNDQEVTVYLVNGTKVASAENTAKTVQFKLPVATYVVKIGKYTVKVKVQ